MGMETCGGGCAYTLLSEAFDWCSGPRGCRADCLAGIRLHHGSFGVMSFFFFLSFSPGRILSQLILWQRHEITCNHHARGEGNVLHVVKRIWLMRTNNNKNWEEVFLREETVTLSQAPEEMAEQSPPKRRVECGVLSTWAMLSCCCLVMKEAIVLLRASKETLQPSPEKWTAQRLHFTAIPLLACLKTKPVERATHGTSWDKQAFYYSWLLMGNLSFTFALNYLRAAQPFIKGGGWVSAQHDRV